MAFSQIKLQLIFNQNFPPFKPMGLILWLVSPPKVWPFYNQRKGNATSYGSLSRGSYNY